MILYYNKKMNMAYENETLQQKEESSFVKDFMNRLDKYSSLGWKNRKGLDKATVQWQVPAFAINFISSKQAAHLKKFPEVYQALTSVSIAFQYVKYKPKEAVRRFTQAQLNKSKFNIKKINTIRKRNWQKTLRMPTRESMGIKEKVEKFKENYPKILKRKRDWEIDTIKSDWTWYLVSFVTWELKDWQSIGSDFFFRNPVIFSATTKTVIIDKVYKKVRRILSEIEEISESFRYWDEADYQNNKKALISLALSLTPKGLLQALEEERKQEAEISLNKIKEEDSEIKLELDWDELNEQLS